MLNLVGIKGEVGIKVEAITVVITGIIALIIDILTLSPASGVASLVEQSVRGGHRQIDRRLTLT